MDVLELYPSESKEQARELADRLEAGKQLTDQLIYTTSQGEQRRFDLRLAGLSDGRSLAFVEDITESKELLRELKMKNKAIQESATGFAFSDQTGQIVEVNKSFLQLWGYETEAEVKGLKPQDLHPTAEVERLSNALTKIKREDSWQGELKAVKADGTEFDVHVASTALKDESGTVQGMMASFIDITTRKERAEELKQKKSELTSNYEELLALNEELVSTQQKLIDLNESFEQKIESGKELHNQLLPTEFPRFDSFYLSGLYQPAENIGGDFYNTVELADKVVFYLADITGHSLDGAFLNIFLRETINNYLFSRYKPGKGLSPAMIADFIISRYKKEGFTADYFISLILFVIDKESKQIKYVNLGQHVQPLLVKSGVVRSLDLAELPISTALDRSEYNLTEQSFNLATQEKLLVSTDGLVEEVVDGRRYGRDRLKSLVIKNQQLPPSLLLDRVKRDFEEFRGTTNQQDDISMVAVACEDVIDRFSTSIASDYQLVAEVKEGFSEFINPYCQEINPLLMGLHEMIINAIEHGNQKNHARQVEVEAVVTPDYLKVEIKDEGSGFKWEEKQGIGLDSADFSERGRGIAITEKAFDRVCYNLIGNKAILYKELG